MLNQKSTRSNPTVKLLKGLNFNVNKMIKKTVNKQTAKKNEVQVNNQIQEEDKKEGVSKEKITDIQKKNTRSNGKNKQKEEDVSKKISPIKKLIKKPNTEIVKKEIAKKQIDIEKKKQKKNNQEKISVVSNENQINANSNNKKEIKVLREQTEEDKIIFEHDKNGDQVFFQHDTEKIAKNEEKSLPTQSDVVKITRNSLKKVEKLSKEKDALNFSQTTSNQIEPIKINFSNKNKNDNNNIASIPKSPEKNLKSEPEISTDKKFLIKKVIKKKDHHKKKNSNIKISNDEQPNFHISKNQSLLPIKTETTKIMHKNKADSCDKSFHKKENAVFPQRERDPQGSLENGDIPNHLIKHVLMESQANFPPGERSFLIAWMEREDGVIPKEGYENGMKLKEKGFERVLLEYYEQNARL